MAIFSIYKYFGVYKPKYNKAEDSPDTPEESATSKVYIEKKETLEGPEMSRYMQKKNGIYVKTERSTWLPTGKGSRGKYNKT